jgi:hypothetical protein
MNRRVSALIAGLAVAFAAYTAPPERQPAITQIEIEAADVHPTLSTGSRLFIGKCAECEPRVLAMSGDTRFAIGDQASTWAALSAYLKANPQVRLQVVYRIQDLTAVRLVASGQ